MAFGLAAIGTACIDLVGSDLNRYVERDEKHFTTGATPDLVLSTFDGSIEIRAWDKSEVDIAIEKRASTKEALEQIDVEASQNGNRVTVNAKAPETHGFGIRFNFSRSAKLIVSAPAGSTVSAKSGDGSITIERIAGRVDLRSGDGSIRGRELRGDVKAHTGDGSIRLDDVRGALDVDTGDGSVTVSGALTSVRARSGDGSITIHAAAGSQASEDWNISTGDGSVVLELPDGFSGELDAHTGDGSVRLHDLQLSNVTGEIGRHTLRGRLGSGGKLVRVRSGDGSITLRKSTMSAEREPTSPDGRR
jgi:hypothetical protein